MILPDPDGKAWDACGRIASMWLRLVTAFARGTPARDQPVLREGPQRSATSQRCDGCGQTPCRWSVPCGTRAKRRRPPS